MNNSVVVVVVVVVVSFVNETASRLRATEHETSW